MFTFRLQYGNRSKSSWKKSFRKKGLLFCTKIPVEKKVFSKTFSGNKVLPIRHFFLVAVWFYTKMSPEKILLSRKCMGTKSCQKKEQLILETPMAIFKVQMHKKSFRLDLIFTILRTLFHRFFPPDIFSSGSYFQRLYWEPPYYFRKKIPGIQNTGLYFQWHFFQGLEKIHIEILVLSILFFLSVRSLKINTFFKNMETLGHKTWLE